MTWFQALGVFYPAVTAVFAGLNMSTDLAQPAKSVPRGTYSALGTAVVVYLLLLFGLAAVCPRYLLLSDPLVVQKVSLIRWFLLLGIYVSSASASLGTMFGIPRIIQNMANEQILPFSNVLSRLHGNSRVPVAATLLFTLSSFCFILSADFNQIATIVTVTVLFTYALVEYAYFCLAFTLKLQHRQDGESVLTRSYTTQESLASSGLDNEYGSCEKVHQNDLDKLFPERIKCASQSNLSKQDVSSIDELQQSNNDLEKDNSRVQCQEMMSQQFLNNSVASDDFNVKSSFCVTDYVFKLVCQPQFMLLSAIGKVFLMFCVHWKCSIVVFLVAFVSWLYLGRTCAIGNRGCSEFDLLNYLKQKLTIRSYNRRSVYDEIVVQTEQKPCLQVKSTVISQQGQDFADREKIHQTSTSNQINP